MVYERNKFFPIIGDKEIDVLCDHPIMFLWSIISHTQKHAIFYSRKFASSPKGSPLTLPAALLYWFG